MSLKKKHTEKNLFSHFCPFFQGGGGSASVQADDDHPPRAAEIGSDGFQSRRASVRFCFGDFAAGEDALRSAPHHASGARRKPPDCLFGASHHHRSRDFLLFAFEKDRREPRCRILRGRHHRCFSRHLFFFRRGCCCFCCCCCAFRKTCIISPSSPLGRVIDEKRRVAAFSRRLAAYLWETV